MNDTTAKRATLRGGHSRAGQLMAKTPRHCLDCNINLCPLRTLKRDIREGFAIHKGHGYCSACYYRRERAGVTWDAPKPDIKIQWRAADLVAEWDFLRAQCGLNREQAAERLGVKPSTLTTAAHRARKYAERDKARAEYRAAELEAHRINDDMNAYAARKQAAA